MYTNKKPDVSVKKLRHKAEIPLIKFGLFIIVIAVCLGCYFLLNGGELSKWMSAILFGLLFPIIGFFAIRKNYWASASNGVEITATQFPEIYQIFMELADEMGFSKNGPLKTPRLYINNGNGTMNAFAAKCTLRRRYIVIYSDLLDVYYSHKQNELVRFVLAHELAHHKCGHTNLWRLILAPALKPLFLDKSLTRAQEYTADRTAVYYAEEGALDLIYLYSGKYMGDKVNIDEYFKSIDTHDNSFWLKLNNFLSDHPVGYRRMQVLKEAKENGWDVHGKML
ncbi:M48 family metallopeptidase [Staphylococcus delphini]|uniref:M48 family metallopeptidase n=1 Tax=Staphylococcus delphini TaxID=53344 RepID=UPI0021D286AA|nr:M48 family metallopeptidase [Staphylococcus delphini]UXS57675.1 M48 family metallopeptidase [Staphylococcus delphini]